MMERRGLQPFVERAERLPNGDVLFVLVWEDGCQFGLRLGEHDVDTFGLLRFLRGDNQNGAKSAALDAQLCKVARRRLARRRARAVYLRLVG